MAASLINACRKKIFINSVFLNKVCFGGSFNCCYKRNLLSSAYLCEDKWKQRLESPALKHIDINEFIVKIHDKFEKQSAAAAIDMDVFANRIQDIEITQLDFAEKILYRFRHCQEALNVKESTPYALVRGYIELEEADRIVQMIQDKFGYGIFPDKFSANILMDHFIKQENYEDAAIVAYEMMLQEEFPNEINRLLSLYSCHMHFNNPPAPLIEEDEEEEAEENNTQQTGETIYKRIPYLRNPHFDDHFDLHNDNHLLGKTLVAICQNQNDLIGYSYRLIGYGLYEKFDKGLNFLENNLESKEFQIDESALKSFEKSMNEVETVPPEETNKPGKPKRVNEEMKNDFITRFTDISKKLQDVGKVSTNDLNLMVKNYVESNVKSLEPKDIEEQLELLTKWNDGRETAVQIQIKALRDTQKKNEIIQKLRQLQRKEELLNYFVLQEKIDLARAKVPKPKFKKTEKIEEDPKVLALLGKKKRKN